MEKGIGIPASIRKKGTEGLQIKEFWRTIMAEVFDGGNNRERNFCYAYYGNSKAAVH